MHEPVLLDETIEYLAPERGDTVFDGTGGGGGHSAEILRKITPGGKIIVVDKDPEAVERCRERLKAFGEAAIFVNSDFRHIDRILEIAGVSELDAAVMDLGMSSFQVDEASRGFSFLKDGPLDMRYDPSGGASAAEIVNRMDRQGLVEIFREYGEERHAKKLADAIVRERRSGAITTTGQLKEIAARILGAKYRNQKLHPAVRMFQALRISVNDELAAVQEALDGLFPRMRPGGRICVISFHSLEDRIVKNTFRRLYRAGEADMISKKPLRPSRDEVDRNPRSRSAKLRVIRKAE